jgi:polysaccharide pyruvyl transferase CsaB
VRFLLSGYYGFDNLGDEALLQIIVAQLRDRYPYAAIEVLSAKPEMTRHALGVDATPRADFRAVLGAIERADVVLSGGGGLLQNATSLKSLLYYAGIIRSAVRAGKPTIVFAQSIGPLDFVGRQIVRESCRGIAAATVRDARSQALLAPLLPGVRVERTADPVFLIDLPAERDDLANHGLGAGSDPLVLVSVRPWRNFGDGAGRVAEAVDRLASAHGARIGFVAFGGPADAEACTVVMRKCRTNPTLLPVDGVAELLHMFARARLVIGMRLHSLILAIRLGVPFIAVSYDPKISAMCEDIGYPLAPLWTAGERRLKTAAPTELADEAWSRRDELAGLTRSAAERMRSLALENFTVLERTLSQVGGPRDGRAEGKAFT